MSNAQQPDAVHPLLRALLANRKAFRIAVVVLGAAFLAYLGYMLLRHGLTFRLPYAYAALMGVSCLVVALLDVTIKDEDEALQVRLELMLLGGLLGLCTALFGVGLWAFTYREQIAGGLEKWRENWGALAWPGLALLGGLVLMFLSVQLVRGMERRNQALRRVIYGYNVVLTTLLLLAVLTLPNVLAYAEPFTRFFGRPFDWTQSNINAISDPLRNMLADLRQPVRAYLIMPPGSFLQQDMKTLLDNCRGLSPKFTWELINPRSPQNRQRLQEMMQTYNISDPVGLLVVAESESEKAKPEYAFLKDSDLADEFRGGRGPVSYSFLGENALLKTLQWLTEGKLVIYFTQGHGELKLDGGPAPRMPARRPGGDSLSTLRSRLTDRKGVEVKPLNLDANTKAIPDDASVVVIARPTRAFGKAEVEALRNYVRRNATTRKVKDSGKEEETVTPGKLFLLLDPVIQKEGDSATMMRTGLEELLAEYNVRLGMNRVLNTNPQLDPTMAICWTVEDSTNPIARAFHPDPRDFRMFQFFDVRTVDPLAPEDKGGTKAVQRLMETIPLEGVYYWAETDLNRSPTAVAEAIRNDPALAEKRLSRTPLTVAVTVADAGSVPGMPRDMAHAGLQKDTPRMVVFGTAGWLANESLEGARGRVHVDLFNSCVQWLRERSSLGVTIEGKKRKEYDPNIQSPDAGKLLYLPLGLLLLSVVGLGMGVWVVRRR